MGKSCNNSNNNHSSSSLLRRCPVAFHGFVGTFVLVLAMADHPPTVAQKLEDMGGVEGMIKVKAAWCSRCSSFAHVQTGMYMQR